VGSLEVGTLLRWIMDLGVGEEEKAECELLIILKIITLWPGLSLCGISIIDCIIWNILNIFTTSWPPECRHKRKGGIMRRNDDREGGGTPVALFA